MDKKLIRIASYIGLFNKTNQITTIASKMAK